MHLVFKTFQGKEKNWIGEVFGQYWTNIRPMIAVVLEKWKTKSKTMCRIVSLFYMENV